MSDSPNIIRQDVQHSVTVTEGSQVATSKPSDPISPQVRQNLVGEDGANSTHQAEAEPALPAPITASAAPDAPVFERVVSTAEASAIALPPAAPAPAAGDAPVFERSLQDETAQAAPALAPVDSSSESAVDQFLRERRLAVPPDQQEAPSEPEAPVFERSMQDHRIALPEQTAAGADPTDGSVFERSMQDRTVDVPAPPPALAPAAVGTVRSAPREGSSPGPAAERKEPALVVPPPLELAQAQQIIAETAREVQTRVEETIGAADAQWAEMDFPARVVKLKIENDKVRTKLDELEDLADRQAR